MVENGHLREAPPMSALCRTPTPQYIFAQSAFFNLSFVIFLSFGKRRQAWPRSNKCHRLTCYSFVRSSFVWKSFWKRSATLQSFPVDTIQADQIANTSFAQCESNNKSNNTHHFSIQSFIEIPSYHPWEPGSSHTELTSLEITDIYISATPTLQIDLFPHSILWTYTHIWSECYDSVSLK